MYSILGQESLQLNINKQIIKIYEHTTHTLFEVVVILRMGLFI